MKAPDESGKIKDFPKEATEWIATAGKTCTDAGYSLPRIAYRI